LNQLVVFKIGGGLKSLTSIFIISHYSCSIPYIAVNQFEEESEEQNDASSKASSTGPKGVVESLLWNPKQYVVLSTGLCLAFFLTVRAVSLFLSSGTKTCAAGWVGRMIPSSNTKAEARLKKASFRKVFTTRSSQKPLSDVIVHANSFIPRW
jgi:hypothetical protein